MWSGFITLNSMCTMSLDICINKVFEHESGSDDAAETEGEKWGGWGLCLAMCVCMWPISTPHNLQTSDQKCILSATHYMFYFAGLLFSIYIYILSAKASSEHHRPNCYMAN